jgi:hypothetical protein
VAIDLADPASSDERLDAIPRDLGADPVRHSSPRQVLHPLGDRGKAAWRRAGRGSDWAIANRPRRSQ